MRFPKTYRKINQEESLASIVLARELSEKVENYNRPIEPFETSKPSLPSRDCVEGFIRMSMPVSLQKSTNLALLEEKRVTPESSKASTILTPVVATKLSGRCDTKSGVKQRQYAVN